MELTTQEDVDVNNLFITDSHIELTNKINTALAKGIDYEEDNDLHLDMIDFKYYTIDSFYDHSAGT